MIYKYTLLISFKYHCETKKLNINLGTKNKKGRFILNLVNFKTLLSLKNQLLQTKHVRSDVQAHPQTFEDIILL